MNSETMECMCLECGVSHYLPLADLVTENTEAIQRKMVTNMACSQCGGALILIGRAGDQPNYVSG